MQYVNVSNITIIAVKGADYCCIIHDIIVDYCCVILIQLIYMYKLYIKCIPKKRILKIKSLIIVTIYQTKKVMN